jgi:hypothetical protein
MIAAFESFLYLSDRAAARASSFAEYDVNFRVPIETGDKAYRSYELSSCAVRTPKRASGCREADKAEQPEF